LPRKRFRTMAAALATAFAQRGLAASGSLRSCDGPPRSTASPPNPRGHGGAHARRPAQLQAFVRGGAFGEANRAPASSRPRCMSCFSDGKRLPGAIGRRGGSTPRDRECTPCSWLPRAFDSRGSGAPLPGRGWVGLYEPPRAHRAGARHRAQPVVREVLVTRSPTPSRNRVRIARPPAAQRGDERAQAFPPSSRATRAHRDESWSRSRFSSGKRGAWSGTPPAGCAGRRTTVLAEILHSLPAAPPSFPRAGHAARSAGVGRRLPHDRHTSVGEPGSRSD